MQSFTELHDKKAELKTTVNHDKSGETTVISNKIIYPTRLAILKQLVFPYGYLSPVIWMTIEAFAASITAALSSLVILRIVAPNDMDAFVCTAGLTGPLILLAEFIGQTSEAFSDTRLYDHPKQWRFLLEFLHIFACFVGLISSMVPSVFWFFACVSILSRCVIGTAIGSSEIAFEKHQAHNGNDRPDKDLYDFQGLIIFIVVILTPCATVKLVYEYQNILWSLFLVSSTIQLYTTYRAVRRYCLISLNRNKLTILIDAFLQNGDVSSVFDLNEAEPLFSSICGTIHLGVSLKELYEYAEKTEAKLVEIATVSEAYDENGYRPFTEGYVLCYDSNRNTGYIAFEKCNHLYQCDRLKPFIHLHFLSRNQAFIKEKYETFLKILEEKKYKINSELLSYGKWEYEAEK